MKITLIQPSLRFRDWAANIREVERLMNQAPGSDLYVLPEMWATGFDVSPSAETREAGQVALAWMHRQAEARQAAVVGSLAVDTMVDAACPASGSWSNRFYFVLPEGQTFSYDKIHLFAPGGECRSFLPGRQEVVAVWQGVRFRLQVCFDLRFPESARRNREMPYDVLLNVANWPASRAAARELLLRARAIENQVIVVGVNAVGMDYGGQSLVLDAEGNTVIDAGNQAGTWTFEPDLEAVRRLRNRFPLGLE